ncbi:hypothetical protein ACEUZ9_004117 [Paracoccus litorisediminis]|uniref:hypothetical protein n=1 Tax=Paracoccus litorisediminis TaxID=2006130 RepID=UPI003731E65F
MVRAFDQLKALPEVMTVSTVAAMLDLPSKSASLYLSRWQKAGMTQALGERTGVHFNLVRNPEAPEERLMDALQLLLPGAVIGGASALHAAGWTTQIPRSLELIVPARPSLPQIPGVDPHQRSNRWFRKIHDGLIREGTLPRMAPAAALADAWISGLWRPDPDEIEWDEIPQGTLEAAFSLMGQPLPAEIEEVLVENSQFGFRF